MVLQCPGHLSKGRDEGVGGGGEATGGGGEATRGSRSTGGDPLNLLLRAGIVIRGGGRTQGPWGAGAGGEGGGRVIEGGGGDNPATGLTVVVFL